MTKYINNKIIIIDDEEIIRNTVSEILTGSYTENTELKEAENELFGGGSSVSQSSSSELFSFNVDCAADGKSGLSMIKKAQAENRPYAAAFIDMRMPVWDGLKTAKMIQKIDQRIEIVFLTAYSDYSIEELVKNLGRNIGYHCKPFERSEIRQIATKLCGDWSRLRDLEGLISSISEIQMSAHGLSSIKETVEKILTSWLPAQSLLLVAKSGDSLDCLVAKGDYENHFEDKSILSKLIDDSHFTEGMLVDEGGIVTYKSGSCHLIVSGQELSGFKQDKLFLIQIFVENISKTLDNARLNQQIKDKEKLSTIGEALAKVVHDLRMPAGFPQMAIELIRECPEDTDQTHHLMDLMIRSSLDMECYLNDILEFSAKLTLKKITFSLSELASELQDEFNLLLKTRTHETSIKCNIGDEIHADRYKLKRAIQNIARNSFEAFEQKGLEKGQLSITFSSDQQSLLINLQDNAGGIPPELIGHIFTPFKSSEKSSGSGLGCAIACQVVEAHGGKISVRNGTEGAIFSLVIPL